MGEVASRADSPAVSENLDRIRNLRIELSICSQESFGLERFRVRVTLGVVQNGPSRSVISALDKIGRRWASRTKCYR